MLTRRVPKFAEAGTWVVEAVNLADRVTNQVYLSGFQLQTLGIPGTLEVTSSPEDTTPPALFDFSIVPTFINTSTGPQNITVQYTLTDDLSGVSFSSSPYFNGAQFSSPSGSQYRLASSFSTSLVSGTPQNGVWQSSVYFAQYSEDGDWLATLSFGDAANNRLFLNTAQLDTLGIPRLVVVRPSLTGDGTIDPTTGGVVQDDTFGGRAQLTAPPGAFSNPTDVAIDVFEEPLSIPNPVGFAAPGTRFVNVELTPTPTFPLAAPGLTIVLPVEDTLPPGLPLSLFKVDTTTGLLVPAIGVSGLPVIGAVDPSGLSATFTGIASFSTVVGLIAATPCDADHDGAIDMNDIRAITGARNTPAETGDPRDVDADGIITALDARHCVLRCTNPRCTIGEPE